jgi:hypothetical protein
MMPYASAASFPMVSQPDRSHGKWRATNKRVLCRINIPILTQLVGCVVICTTVLCAALASAQTTQFRDKNGNPQGYIKQEGSRSVLRDNSGNPHGYWQKEGDFLVHRDNAGNLRDRQQMK